MLHGSLETTGWLLTEGNSNEEKKSIAYLTDCNYISEESIEVLHKSAGKLVHLIIDGLRIKEHSTHFSFLQALEVSAKIGAEHIWFTHLTHNSSHEETTAYIAEHKKEFPGLAAAKSILPAYDGLVIEA
jgi:phosphoribosyl 1,2-cyclic phosphate phosphodiesterase